MRRAALVALFVLLMVPAAHASNRYDPRLKFRTISTPRFDIHFHQGGDQLARRLASLAEAVATDLEPKLGRPRARVHVILVDQTDIANGWATPVPYNLIEIAVTSPRADSSIGNTSDWLRMVFTHEYTHVVHLERSRGFIGAVGRAFGRNPFFYPNLALPTWQIEGLATYHESGAGEGRLFAGDFRHIMDRAASAGRFASLDRASSGIINWPGGHTRYLYGGFFHQYLVDTYGADSLRQLADATAGRIPYFGTPAFEKVFGKSLGILWSDFARTVAAHAPPTLTEPRRLTHHGFAVQDPWFSGDVLLYSVANPHGFPALMEWRETGAVKLTTRFGGEQITTAGGRTIVFDQHEYVQSVALQSDLWARDSSDGQIRRLTREARAADPDLRADGALLVCTVQTPKGRALATLPMPAAGQVGTPSIIASETDSNFASPRWSPDGRRIAVERRRIGGPSEIVVLDPTTGAVERVLATSSRGRNTTPVWSRDGRTVYFGSDRDGPFQIYSAEMTSGALRRLEGTGLSAESPAVSADGKTLVFVGYTPEGYDLFSLPLDGAIWQPVPAGASPSARPAAPAAVATVAEPDKAYSPLSTLVPRFWTPIIEEDGDNVAVGAATSGADALGRHGYYASAAWSTRGRPDWAAAYAYDRLRPMLFANMSDDQEAFRSGDIRVREVNAGAQLSFRRVRRAQVVVGTFHAAREQIDCAACEPAINEQADRRALRAGWLYDGARRFGYSISDEEGFIAVGSAEWTRSALGADGNATAVVGDLRGYLRAGPRHAVIASRIGAAHAWGDRSVRRIFAAGANGAALPLIDFDPDAIALVRGFDSADANGRTSIVVNLDYRIPLAWIERGYGTWPLLLRSIHGALFADGGGAWDADPSRNDWRASFGAELSADVVVGYSLPLTLTAGVAVRYDPTHRSDGAAVFARVGRAF